MSRHFRCHAICYNDEYGIVEDSMINEFLLSHFCPPHPTTRLQVPGLQRFFLVMVSRRLEIYCLYFVIKDFSMSNFTPVFCD